MKNCAIILFSLSIFIFGCQKDNLQKETTPDTELARNLVFEKVDAVKLAQDEDFKTQISQAFSILAKFH